MKQIPGFRNLYAFGKKLPIDLTLSENPLGCSPVVSRALKNITQKDLFSYPDADCAKLRLAIAARFGLEIETIFVSNGSEAFIKMLPQILLAPGDEVIIPSLTFPMFAIASRIAGARVVFSRMTDDFDIDFEDIQSKISGRTKMIFLCNPNNPTGRIISKKKLLDFVKSVAANVIIDEANIEFGGESLIKEVSKNPNIILLRTFSKAFGLAGIRVGFCVADREIICRIKQVSQPFPVSAISQKVAVAAFADRGFIEKTKKFMDGERLFLTKELTRRGFTVVPSQANNLLVLLEVSSTDFVKKLNSRGVSVVDGASFKFKGAYFIRVSPRLRETNCNLLQAIDRIR